MHESDAPPLAALPVTLIMNAAAGVRHAAGLPEQLRDALGAGGRAVRLLRPDDPAAIPKLAAQALAAGPGLIVAAGGDGTANSVAGALLGRKALFGVIPLGTFNYFARALGMPADPLAAAQAIAAGRLTTAAVGTVNGRVFLNNASFGLYRAIIEAREQHKAVLGRHRLVAAVSGLYTALRLHPYYQVRLTLDHETLTRRTPMVFFGANPLQLGELGMDGEIPGLGVLVMHPMSRWQVLATALHALFGRLAQVDTVETLHAREIVVERAKKRVRLVVDGEIVRTRAPLDVRWVPDALSVVVPPAAAP